MEAIPQLLDYLNGLGVTGERAVILALVIVAGRWIGKRMDKLVTVYTEAARRGGGKSPSAQARVDGEWAERSGAVNAELRGLLSSLSADRAFVFQFHNGDSNPCGVHFRKASKTHVVSVPQYPGDMRSFQGLHVQFLLPIVGQVIRKRFVKVHSVQDIATSEPGIAALLTERRVKSLYCHGIYTADGTVIGFVGVDYCRGEMMLENESLAPLREAAIRIGVHLSSGDESSCSL